MPFGPIPDADKEVISQIYAEPLFKALANFMPLNPGALASIAEIDWEGERGWLDELWKVRSRKVADLEPTDSNGNEDEDASNSYIAPDLDAWNIMRERDRSLTLDVEVAARLDEEMFKLPADLKLRCGCMSTTLWLPITFSSVCPRLAQQIETLPMAETQDANVAETQDTNAAETQDANVPETQDTTVVPLSSTMVGDIIKILTEGWRFDEESVECIRRGIEAVADESPQEEHEDEVDASEL
ncbi:hypothetical protein H0H81_005124 [Sphagnurus paluster]|uniref:Uncharacterized protein n=1 Tax=Sphagnurus paluster TaxID=117069 RepID=A0A9P7GRW9_9AGAR|nr:hypothetical protein H0H81_005124 [Sphagnurus paluster]